MLIDTHCHVLSSEYDNVNEIIEDAFSNGVNKLIINGFDVDSSKEALRLAEAYENVYAAVGIGPENIDLSDDAIRTIEKLSENDKVVAIGEIGLDYYWTTDNKNDQIKLFIKMLEIAKHRNLPVIVHSRKASEDTYNYLKEYNVKGILHCYSGSTEMAKRFIDLGFLLGIGGVITFKNAKELKEVVNTYEVDNFALETDSPYLSPEPFRGQKNMPRNVRLVAEKIAEIKDLKYEEILDKTGHSVTQLFDL